MKRRLIILIMLAAAVLCLAACGQDKEKTGDAGESGKLSIVTTIFPEYDWVKQIIGDKADNAEITMLLDNGVDLHSYQPAAEDILKIAGCDVFIYVGGESDGWAEDALKEADDDLIVINLMDELGSAVREEELVPGMQAEDEHEDKQTEEPEYDEHVWLSLKNSVVLCDVIEKALAKADSANADTYKANAAAYIEKLKALDAEYKNTVEEAKCKTLLFGDRFPFRYMADDYGIEYYAAFVGCSAETEASFETVTFLAGKMDELGLDNIMTIESSDKKIAETIIQNSDNTGRQILTMDSLQSLMAEDATQGVSYLSVMTNNLEILKKALN